MLKKILLIALISTIALFAAVYFFGSKILNVALKQAIQSGAPLVTQCEVAIDDLELSLFSGEGQVHGFSLKNPTGFSEKNLFELHNISVKVDPESLLSQEVHIHSIEIHQPKFCFEQILSGSNWQTLIQNLQAFSAQRTDEKPSMSDKPENNSSDSTMPKIRIDSLSIQEAEVEFSAFGFEKILKIPSIRITDLNTQNQALEAHELLLQISQKILKEISQVAMPLKFEGSETKSLIPEGALQELRQAIIRKL